MKRSTYLATWFAWMMSTTALLAADWPQYRGLNHDGSSSESLRTDWAQKPPTVVWKKTIQPAWSSITVSGGRVFTQVNRVLSREQTDACLALGPNIRPQNGFNRDCNGQHEVCVALNADTGAELWSTPLDRAAYPDAGTGSTDGPRSTPTIEGDRVYVFTSYLKLYCLRADTGAVVWSRDFIAEFPGTDVIDWQNAASPLLIGDLIFLNSNVANQRLMAVRKSDGVKVWSGQNDTMTHATPTYATIAGTPQVVFLTLSGMVGVVPESGAVLWRYNFSPSATSTAATPIAANDYVYASCAYGQGARTARITKAGNTFSAVQTNYRQSSSYQNHWATPVHHDGYLYSVVEAGNNNSLSCLSLAGRTNTWITATVGGGSPGFASVIKVGGKILVLRESGELVLLEPNPAAYTQIARYQALTGTSWNHPAFSNGRIYARSNTQIVALDVAAAVVPLPALKIAADLLLDLGRLKVRVLAANGTPLTASDAGRVQVQSAATLGAGTPDWQTLALTFNAVDGGLEADIPTPADTAFLRVQERTAP